MSHIGRRRQVADGAIVATLTDYAPGARIDRHAHGDIAITLVISGDVAESTRRRTEWAGAWSIGVKPFALEHADVFGGNGARLACLSITDPRWLDDREVHAAVSTWRWMAAGPVAPLLCRLATSLRADRPAGPWLRTLAIDVIARLHDDPRARIGGRPPAWLQRIRSRCLEESAGVDSSGLAAEAGLHPVTLARLFRRAYGESISDCVRRARLQRAARLLTASAAAIADIAAASGCADQSHLTRLMSREAGTTPLGIRRLASCDRSRFHGDPSATVHS